MEVWAVANQKGGVGKTTTVISLAGELSRRGVRSLIVDFDPQGSMSSYLGYDPDTLKDSAYRLFQPHLGEPAVPIEKLFRDTSIDCVQLLPASRGLATLDRQLAGKDGMGLVLKQALACCAERFDQVLIDCPPIFGVLMLNALAACDTLIIPVQTEYLAIKGLERMLHTLGMVAKAGKRPLRRLVVPTMFDQRTRASRDSLELLRRSFADDLWSGLIPIDTRFRDASRAGQPLSMLAPGSRGAEAYAALLDQLAGPGAEPDAFAPPNNATTGGIGTLHA